MPTFRICWGLRLLATTPATRRSKASIQILPTNETLALPQVIQVRVEAVVDRLEKWPQVSGVKWLTGDWKGHARIRTGDYRVIFRIEGDVEIIVVRIADRRDAYAD
ncbi:MAG: type II toxin-antitoxin system RelE/ParE family toxin [Pirellulales bacterium]